MERYYAAEGASDTVLITLPKGSYIPQFQVRSSREPAPLAPEADDRRQPPGRVQRLSWFDVGGIAVLGVVAFSMWIRNRPAPPGETGPLQFEAELSLGDRLLGSDFGNNVILSPDGKRVAFVTRGQDGVLRLMTGGLGQRTTTELSGTDGARAPFFSKDGRWVGFWADAKLKKVAVDGGQPMGGVRESVPS